MKLKYKFVVKNVAGNPVAVAVGQDNERFNGMIKLNNTGEVIFNLLNKGEDITIEEIVAILTEKYDVAANDAFQAASEFIDTLDKSGLID